MNTKPMNPKALKRLTEAGLKDLDSYYHTENWKKFRDSVIKIFKIENKWFCWACAKAGEDDFNLHLSQMASGTARD